MEQIKKIICFCTALLMISSLISCNQGKSNTTLLSSDNTSSNLSDANQTNYKSSNTNKITTYYDQHILEGIENFSDISRIRYSGDKLYALGHTQFDTDGPLFSTDLNTFETVSIEKDSNPDTYDSGDVCTDKKGNTYKCTYENLKIYDKEDNLTKTIDKSFFDGYDDVKNLSFYSYAVSENGDIYIAASLNTSESIQIIKLNDSYQIQYITEKGALSDCGSTILRIFIGKNGNPVLCTQSDITYINEISAESGRTLLRYDIGMLDNILGQYGNYDIVYQFGNTISGYNYQSHNTTDIYTTDNSDYAIKAAFLKDDCIITKMIHMKENSDAMTIYNKDGKPEKNISISQDDEIIDMSITDDGTVYLLSEHFEPDYTDDTGAETTQFNILRLNEDGTTEKICTGKKQKDRMYHNFCADNKGNMCVCVPYSSDGIIQATYISPDGKQSDIIYECFESANEVLCINDELYIMCYKNGDNNTCMLHINKETHTIDKTTDLILNMSRLAAGADENDLLYLSGNVVYGYNIAKNSSEKIFSWFDSDAEYIPYDIKNIIIADSDNIFYVDYDSCNYENNSGIQVSLIHLKKSDKERLEKLNTRNMITLAGVNIGQSYFTRIKKFNNSDSGYMIRAMDYSQYNSLSGEDNSEGFSKMEEDIKNGIIPDIILGDLSDNACIFSDKNMFADLNVFLRNDPEIDSSDLADNILNACTYNEKLWCFPCRFALSTFTMPDEYTQNNDTLTYDDFFSFADKFGDTTFINTSRENVFASLIPSYINDNIDLVNSKCSFDTDVFRKILEKLKDCTPGELFYSDDYNFNYDSVIDQRILKKSNIQKLFYLYFDMKDNNSEHISYNLKGIPSSTGVTSLIEISHSIGITDLSENKEGAWEFLKYYANIKDGWGISIDNIGNPLSIYRSKNVETINSSVSRISDEQNNFDQSDRDKFSVALNNLCNGKIIYTDTYSKIYSIINEEAEKFYNDTQSIEETVSAVQSKAEQYLSQMR